MTRPKNSSTARKTARAASWTQGKSRSRERQEKQNTAHRRNVASGTSPWQESQQARKIRRRTKTRQEVTTE